MATVQITVGLRVQVNVSGLQASSHSAEASAEVRFPSGPGSTTIMTGTVKHIDRVRGLITVYLDGSRIAGHDSVVVPPDRIIAAI
jgi:hypothetical protein